MFTALLRQEFRFTARSLGQILLWSMMTTLASALMVMTGLPIISHLGQFLINSVLVGIGTATAIVLTVHYWRSMHGSYAAFTHSIPVSPVTLFTAKITYYVLAVAASIVPTVLVGLILVGAQAIAAGQDLGQVYSDLWASLKAAASLVTSFWGISAFFVVILLAAVFSVIQFLGAITIGFSGRFNTRGYTGPTIALVVTYFLNQLVGLIALLIIPIGLRIENDVPQGIGYGMMLPELINAIETGSEPTFVGLGSPLAVIPLGILIGWLAIRSLRRHLYVR